METLLASTDSVSPTAREFARLKGPIADALVYAKGSHTLEDVWEAIERGDAQLWAGVQSAIVTEIVQTPQRKELRFWLAGGDMEELEAMYRPIVEWGTTIGCDYAVMVGRRGWERTWLTRDAGWTAEATVYFKELA